MNKEYAMLGNKVLVTDENGELSCKTNNENVLKVLQLENDLEKLNEKLKKYQGSLSHNKNECKSILLESIIYAIVILVIVSGLIALPLTSIIPVLMVVLFRFYIFIGLKKEDASLLSKCKYVSEMIDSLTKEKDKLKKIISEENKMDELIIQKVGNTSSFEETDRYLKLINLYEDNKKKFLTMFKKDALASYMSYSGYNYDDINLVFSFIEKDLKNKEEKGKNRVNIKDISIEKLIELEESLENGSKLNNLNDTELYCLNLAKKIPLHDFLGEREKYVERWYIIDEIKYTQYLMHKYFVTKEELYDRYYTANKIRRYKEKKNSDILKEQKRMIKVINKNKK